jgi:hypothetical protein
MGVLLNGSIYRGEHQEILNNFFQARQGERQSPTIPY